MGLSTDLRGVGQSGSKVEYLKHFTVIVTIEFAEHMARTVWPNKIHNILLTRNEVRTIIPIRMMAGSLITLC